MRIARVLIPSLAGLTVSAWCFVGYAQPSIGGVKCSINGRAVPCGDAGAGHGSGGGGGGIQSPQPQTPPAVQAFNEGIALFKVGNYLAAQNQFRRALDLDPDDGITIYMLAQSFFFQRKYAQALYHFGTLSQPSIKDPRRELVSRRGKIENFIRDCQESLPKGPQVGMLFTSSPGVYYVSAKGEHVPIDSGTDIRLGQRLITDANSRLTITLLDGTEFRVGPNSDLIIDEFVYDPRNNDTARKVVVSLLKGLLRWVTATTDRAHAAIDPEWRLRQLKALKASQAIAIGIRGTDVEVSYVPPEGYIKLFSGEAVATELVSGRVVELKAGYMVKILPNGTVGPSLLMSVPLAR
jgi:hypothetical protein